MYFNNTLKNSKFNELHKKAIATYNTLREQAKVKMEVIVRVSSTTRRC